MSFEFRFESGDAAQKIYISNGLVMSTVLLSACTLSLRGASFAVGNSMWPAVVSFIGVMGSKVEQSSQPVTVIRKNTPTC